MHCISFHHKLDPLGSDLVVDKNEFVTGGIKFTRSPANLIACEGKRSPADRSTLLVLPQLVAMQSSCSQY
jgi:hypothetical protein